MCCKVVGSTEAGPAHSASLHAPNSSNSPPIPVFPTVHEGPASPAETPFRACVGLNLPAICTSPLCPPPAACGAPLLPAAGTVNIPLHQTSHGGSNPNNFVSTFVPIIAACIDLSAAIMHLQIASMEASEGRAAVRRNVRRRLVSNCEDISPSRAQEHATEENATENAHPTQIYNLLACHMSAQDARWYVKPRSTCWFEEYLFQIYTPDMFYDILRMRRATFDRLVHNLRPFIQGHSTHWRQPIGVEKKVVVTLFKLMHGVSIPLVADKAALGKSTVHDILRLVCSAISANFGHLIAWPHGRRLARVTTDFQAKQLMPNCIGAIDGSHVFIAAPPNSVVAADHRNRYKTFSILLQAVVDTKCYFTSVNISPPGSLHDSAHFKSTELYRKVEEGVMGGFHDNPLTWPAALPFPSYIVADRGYPLLSWCITPFKMGPLGTPLTNEEVWFNHKHSSTRMCVERGFGILKARFKEIGAKSALKLEFLPTVVHCCCVLHNMLLASKDRTLDQILRECELPPMNASGTQRRDDEDVFHPPRPMGFVSEERALLEGKMAREDLLDYLVRVQNTNHVSRHNGRA